LNMAKSSTPPHRQDATDKTLRVVAAGLCCAVGYTAQAASCALRAGMDHFQESEFITQNGQPVRVARLPDSENWGSERLAQWMAHALNDCLNHAGALQDAQLMTLWLTAEASRPGIEQRHAHEAATLSKRLFPVPLSPASEVLRAGRAGLGPVLGRAHGLLAQGACKQVLVLGADSYLQAETINHYLQAERLLVPGNRDGFIPGEAAAAVLLELAEPDAPGLHILGWGQGDEPGRPDGSVPTRATGLSTALRNAFEQAGIDCNDLAFRLSDQNGEGFFAGEAANAFTRVAVDGGTTPMVHTTADCVGEVGAATGPLMLAWLHHLLQQPDRPGDCGVIHLANDDGLRSAVVVQVNSTDNHTTN
jgi:3-oxoacyl-[acyl-carrier-protein] synthase I